MSLRGIWNCGTRKQNGHYQSGGGSGLTRVTFTDTYSGYCPTTPTSYTTGNDGTYYYGYSAITPNVSNPIGNIVRVTDKDKYFSFKNGARIDYHGTLRNAHPSTVFTFAGMQGIWLNASQSMPLNVLDSSGNVLLSRTNITSNNLFLNYTSTGTESTKIGNGLYTTVTTTDFDGTGQSATLPLMCNSDREILVPLDTNSVAGSLGLSEIESGTEHTITVCTASYSSGSSAFIIDQLFDTLYFKYEIDNANGYTNTSGSYLELDWHAEWYSNSDKEYYSFGYYPTWLFNLCPVYNWYYPMTESGGSASGVSLPFSAEITIN